MNEVSVLRPLTDFEFATWREATIPVYAADKVASGQWSKDESLELSRKEYDELLPQGRRTPNHYFFAIVDSESVAVGVLWFAVMTKFDARIAYVYDVAIDPGRRREGHAQRAFLALENEIRKLGLTGIALHVFGHNTVAQALYAKLGFQPTNISLFKPIGQASVAGSDPAPARYRASSR